MMMKGSKIVLAYSGGLDTSVILKWLQEEYEAEIVVFTANLGQGDELEEAKAKALSLDVKPENIFIEDLREEFIQQYAFPAYRANAVYEGSYLLGTPIARPLIAKKQIEIAHLVGADAVSHGATGKGNDQVRFELAYYALDPDINVIAPWREWDLTSRTRLTEYAQEHGIHVPLDKKGEPPYSADANLLHISCEGKVLEDPWITAPEDVFTRTVSPIDAPDQPEELIISFKTGDPVALNNIELAPANLVAELNRLGSKHGIGRIDIVDNRYVGMKSRGIFETPGGTIWAQARRALESITLDRQEYHLKDDLVCKYAEIIYNGYWFSPEREMLQALIDKSQKYVTGDVRVLLYKGNVIVQGRRSPYSIYSKDHVTFEADDVFDQQDAEGFIKINALRLRLLNKARNQVHKL